MNPEPLSSQPPSPRIPAGSPSTSRIDRRPASTPPGRHLAFLLVALLLTPVLLTACGGSSSPGTATGDGNAPIAAVDDGMTAGMSAMAKAAWSERPSYVREASATTAAAYAFAMVHPEVLDWMPCYCGCAAMGHGSNADCFFKRHDASGFAFEEHASVCDVCVKTALTAKAMFGRGSSLLEIRNAIDQSFGGSGAPGTVTPMPPAG